MSRRTDVILNQLKRWTPNKWTILWMIVILMVFKIFGDSQHLGRNLQSIYQFTLGGKIDIFYYHETREKWESPYKLPEGCTQSRNRTNPKYNPEPVCEVEYEFGEVLKTSSDHIRPKYSSHSCTDKNRLYCKYENVCVRDKKILYFTPNDDVKWQDFKWIPYRFPFSRNFTFSYHYDIEIIRENEQSNFSKYSIDWVDGTSFWFDQIYNTMCHVGHGSEFYFKAPYLRSKFPGPIKRVIYAHDKEAKHALHKHELCYQVCNLMRLAFKPENYTLPPIYWLEHMEEYKASGDKSLLCFDTLLVISNVKQHFDSRDSADIYRSNGLDMCGIPERALPSQIEAENPKRIFFFERGWNRRIFNAEDLCTYWNRRYPYTFLETDDFPSFCAIMAMVHSADIIVTVEGSQNHFLAFARPGTVILLVSPYHFRLPDWKTMDYYSKLRTVDYIVLNRIHSINHLGKLDDKKTDEKLNAGLWHCYSDSCRFAVQDRDSYIPLNVFNNFMKYAISIWNNLEFNECETPYQWPVDGLQTTKTKRHWWWVYDVMGVQNNYQACEPPYPDCVCCKHADCKTVTNMPRDY